MKLKVLDQISLSAVQASTLANGDEIDVSDSLGEELLKRHPSTFEEIGGGEKKKAARKPKNKAAQTPRNKAAGAPAAKEGENSPATSSGDAGNPAG